MNADFALASPIDKDIGASTIIQCTGHIVLDVYSKGQRVTSNSKYWWAQMLKSASDVIWNGECTELHFDISYDIWGTFEHLRSSILGIWSKLFGPCYTHLIQCVQCIVWWYWAPISLSNGWCKSKICIHYHCVNIRINSLGVMQTLLDPWSRHKDYPWPRMVILTVEFLLCLNQHMHYDSSEIRS